MLGFLHMPPVESICSYLYVCVCVYACVSVSVCSTVAVRRSAIGFHAVVFHKPEKKKYGKNTPYSYCIIAK